MRTFLLRIFFLISFLPYNTLFSGLTFSRAILNTPKDLIARLASVKDSTGRNIFAINNIASLPVEVLENILDLKILQQLADERVSYQPYMILNGHRQSIQCLAWSPSGRRIASGSLDKTINIWDSATGRAIKTLRETYKVWALAWIFEGSHLVSSSGRVIKVWDIEARRVIQELSGHTQRVSVLAVRPGHNHLASASDDGTIKIWDMSTYQVIKNFKTHGDIAISSLAWDHDGSHLGVGFEDGVEQLLDLQSGAIMENFSTEYRFPAIAWNVDNLLRARVVNNEGKVTVLNQISRHEVTLAEVKDFLVFSWNPHAHLLAVGSSRGNLWLSDGATGSLFKQLPSERYYISSLAWSPSGIYLAVGGGEKDIKIYNFAKERLKNYFTQEINKDSILNVEKKMLFLILMALKEPASQLLLEDVVRQSNSMVTLDELKAIRDSFPADIRNLIGQLLRP